MANPTTSPVDKKPTSALSSPTSEKDAVAILPSKKESGEVECLEVVSWPLDDDTANPPMATRAMRRKASIQFAVLCFTNFVVGWNDNVTAPIVPRILEAYHVGYSVVSIGLTIVAVGMIFGSAIYQFLVDRFGFGVISVIASIVVAIGCALQASAAPFPVFVVGSFLMGVGNSFTLVSSKAFVVSQAGDSTTKMMILQVAMGAGSTCAPLAATQFARLPRWSLVYTVNIALAVIAGVIQAFTFRFKRYDECLKEIGQQPLEKTADSLNGVSKYRQILRIPAVHLLALFSFTLCGVQATIAAWTVTFLVESRHGTLTNAGYVATGMYAACTIGPLVLIPLSKKLGGWRAVLLYVPLVLVLELVVWLVPSLIIDGVSVSLIQFFLGPIAPLAVNHIRPVIVAPELFSGAISWIGMFGTLGSMVSVFTAGAIASRTGISNIHALVVAMMGLGLVIWVFVPKHRA